MNCSSIFDSRCYSLRVIQHIWGSLDLRCATITLLFYLFVTVTCLFLSLKHMYIVFFYIFLTSQKEGVCVCVCVCVCYLLSHVWLFVTPWTITRQDPLSMGFSRQEYWSRLPFPSPGDLPDPGIKPGSPALQANSLPSEPPGSPRKT